MGSYCGSQRDPELPSKARGPKVFRLKRCRACVVAQIACVEGHEKNACDELKKYLGVGQIRPENAVGSLDLNAAPQITAATQRLPLLMPMLQGQKVMQCFLPSEYKSVADAAVPTNSAIIIRTIPERVVAVMKFRGKFEVQNHAERLSKFRDLLRKERLLQNTKDPDAQLGQQSSLTTINETCPLLIPEAPLNPPSSESATDAVPQNEVTSVVQPGHWTVAYYFTPGESVCCQKIELWVDVDRNCPEVLKWFPQH